MRFLLEQNACASSEDCFGAKLLVLASLLVAGCAHAMASGEKFRGVRWHLMCLYGRAKRAQQAVCSQVHGKCLAWIGAVG